MNAKPERTSVSLQEFEDECKDFRDMVAPSVQL
jgi:hypothetical protein